MLISFWSYINIILQRWKVRKKPQKQQKSRFFFIFCLLREGSGIEIGSLESILGLLKSLKNRALAASNRFLGFWNVYKFGLCILFGFRGNMTTFYIPWTAFSLRPSIVFKQMSLSKIKFWIPRKNTRGTEWGCFSFHFPNQIFAMFCQAVCPSSNKKKSGNDNMWHQFLLLIYMFSTSSYLRN